MNSISRVYPYVQTLRPKFWEGLHYAMRRKIQFTDISYISFGENLFLRFKSEITAF
jgi:hypothetical protein